MSMKDNPAGWCTAISGTSDNVEMAAAVLNAAYTDPVLLNMIVFGEKDVDYTIDENGYLTPIEGGYAANISANHAWQFGNQQMDIVTKAQADAGLADIWSIQEAFNKAAVPVESAGFYFDQDEVDIEVAALANVVDEYYVMLWNGTCDNLDATLKEFVDKLYANGLQTVLDEANRQYVEFLATK